MLPHSSGYFKSLGTTLRAIVVVEGVMSASHDR